MVLSYLFNGVFVECNCNSEGSKDMSCDGIYGHCICKPNIFGHNCEQCLDGFYEFPKCQGRVLLSIFLK